MVVVVGVVVLVAIVVVVIVVVVVRNAWKLLDVFSTCGPLQMVRSIHHCLLQGIQFPQGRIVGGLPIF